MEHIQWEQCGLDSRETKMIHLVSIRAKWIAARIFPHASTTKALCAFQWGMNPDSNLSTMSDVPDVINCSFTDGGISPTSDCNGASGYWSAVDAVEAAGIAVIWSAGNDGPNAKTISPPKNRNVTNVNFFTVGASTEDIVIIGLKILAVAVPHDVSMKILLCTNRKLLPPT